MSIFSTQNVTKAQARLILLEHLKEIRREIKADPDMSSYDLDVLLNTYVKGNGQYRCTNFMVVDR